MNIPNTDELVCVQTWILVNGRGVQKDEWITKAQQASLAEELESEERLVYQKFDHF